MEKKHEDIMDLYNVNNYDNKPSREDKVSTKRVISLITLIIVISVGLFIYSEYNYNDFVKSIREKGKTSFSRDNSVKCSEMKSYKLENKDYNDAMFYKTIEVEPNTPYKVTCKVKTENVENEKQKYTGGAQIAIRDSVECSESVTGTNDWTELTFMFNSKNRTIVDIGFRLGGYEEKSKGTAWFSDFKLEEGTLDTSKTWNVACFVIKSVDIDANANGEKKHINLSMTEDDINNIYSNMQRVSNTIPGMTANKMNITYDIIEIDEPLTTISYDVENEYYIDPGDAKVLIKKYLEKEEYDYIYVVTRLGNLNVSEDVIVHDWVGLGGIDYYGIGFSNIRLPDNLNSYIYRYDPSINTFPEEVYIHEFLHTLERNEKEYGNEDIANIHNYEEFGYNRDGANGLRNWYTAYMQNSIRYTDGTSAGLTSNAYNSKPIHQSDFKYSYELNDLDEPQNILEEISSLAKRIKLLFKK